MTLPIVVLISGRGSNLQAIIDAVRDDGLPVVIRAVICNRPTAPGLELARRAGIESRVLNHRDYADRAGYDAALMTLIDGYDPGLVVLAGFMRILSDAFVRHYSGRLINIHPSLLPAFTGLDTHARALAAGAAEHGATVHFVTEKLDSGPIVVQARVPVKPDDTAETLAARVLEQEHRIYPLAIRWFADGRLTVAGNRVLLDGAQRPEQGLNPASARQAG
jgi:phosphoribosylglycinamide formyltransferase-1